MRAPHIIHSIHSVRNSVTQSYKEPGYARKLSLFSQTCMTSRHFAFKECMGHMDVCYGIHLLSLR